jgi:hypothetical protein
MGFAGLVASPLDPNLGQDLLDWGRGPRSSKSTGDALTEVQPHPGRAVRQPP